jgi:hypothetical protein
MNAVDSFLDGLNHPCRREIDALRSVIRGSEPGLQESVKWEAPSFALVDHFATLLLKGDGVRLVLHRGTKKVAKPMVPIDVSPLSAKWQAPDRCVVSFSSLADIEAKAPDLVRVLKEWIAQLEEIQGDSVGV